MQTLVRVGEGGLRWSGSQDLDWNCGVVYRASVSERSQGGVLNCPEETFRVAS